MQRDNFDFLMDKRDDRIRASEETISSEGEKSQ